MRTRVALLMVLLALGSTACDRAPGQAPAVSASRAAEIARAYALAGQPSGVDASDVVVGPAVLINRVWRVQIDLQIRNHASPLSQPLPIHLMIDVDTITGKPGVVAQG
jgi:hypothetical protein